MPATRFVNAEMLERGSDWIVERRTEEHWSVPRAKLSRPGLNFAKAQ
jgi:hypothetical protein